VLICHLTEWNIQGPDSIRILYLPLIVKGWTVAPDWWSSGSSHRRRRAGGDQEPGQRPGRRRVLGRRLRRPQPPPTRVNQTWDQLGDEGLVWGVTAAALPLAPGEAITLTVGNA